MSNKKDRSVSTILIDNNLLNGDRKKNKEKGDLTILLAIKMSAMEFNLSPTEQARIVGVARATWYRRLAHPETFTLKELRRMAIYYHWDDVLVDAILAGK